MTPWYAVSLLVHLLALALWLGGIAFFLVVFGPAVHELKPIAGIRILNQGRIAFEALSWVGITLVMITGMTNLILRNQMSGAYLSRYYMIVLTIKLFIFVAMLIHHSLQIFKYGPKIVALTAEVSDELPSWPEPLRSYWQRWFLLLKINAALGPITILLGLALVRS
jgi:putative copper export protein